MLDEREHRRGLVLGLTLAEVLLLLLFLMMLALGSRFAEAERFKQALESEVRELKLELAASNLSITNAADHGKPLTLELSPAYDGAKLDALRTVVASAAKIDPHDPPAVLKRALDTLTRFGTTAQAYEALIVAIERAESLSPENPVAVLDRAVDVISELGTEVTISQAKQCVAAIMTGKSSNGGMHDWPPIITLSESEGYFFKSGSADLTSDFEANLTTKVTAVLLELTQKYDVNVIEVIGHTDEQPLVVRASNLDATLLPFLRGASDTPPMLPADNAGLGFARAASVVRALSEEPRLSSLRILPLSGAQVINVGDALSTGHAPVSIEQRRRIEIRVRRSDKNPELQVAPRTSSIEPARKTSPGDPAKALARKSPAKPTSSDWLAEIFGP